MPIEAEKDKKTPTDKDATDTSAEATENASEAWGKPTAGATEVTPTDVLKQFEEKSE